MNRIFSVLATFITVTSADAQVIEWQKCYGGTDDELAFSIIQTTDGGYVIAGNSASNNGDVSGNHSFDYDYWIVKVNNVGSIEWQKCYGGTQYEVATSIIQTNDNGYLVAGAAQSNDGDVIGLHGTVLVDYWVIKLDSSGNLQWQKCLGGTSGDFIWASTAMVQLQDSSYLISGTTTSNNGDVTGNHGASDCWLVKLDTAGNIQWQKCRGGSGGDGDYVPITKTFDGGYAIASRTTSNDGDVNGNHSASPVIDIWLAKLDSAAELQWQRCLGGTNDDGPSSIVQCSDSGYFIVGGTNSNDGDVSGNHGGLGDIWAIKVSNSGSIQWQKCLGGTYDEGGTSAVQTLDGGYVIAAITQSNNGDVIGLHNAPNTFTDCWIVKLDPSGNIQWQYCFGGEKDDAVYSIIQTADGGYVFAGGTASTAGNVSGFHGGAGRDFWVVKLSPYVGIEENDSSSQINIYPNPTTSQIEIRNLKSETRTIEIYNTLNQRLFFQPQTSNIKPQTIDVSTLPSGIYFVKVADIEGNKATAKFVKM